MNGNERHDVLQARPQNMVLPDMFSACPGGNAAAAAEFHQALLRVGYLAAPQRLADVAQHGGHGELFV